MKKFCPKSLAVILASSTIVNVPIYGRMRFLSVSLPDPDAPRRRILD